MYRSQMASAAPFVDHLAHRRTASTDTSPLLVQRSNNGGCIRRAASGWNQPGYRTAMLRNHHDFASLHLIKQARQVCLRFVGTDSGHARRLVADWSERQPWMAIGSAVDHHNGGIERAEIGSIRAHDRGSMPTCCEYYGRGNDIGRPGGAAQDPSCPS